MKRIITITFLVLLLIPFFVVSSDAYNEGETDEIYSSIDSTTKELLEESGIDSVNFDDLFNLTPEKLIDMFIGVFRNKASLPLKTAGLILSMLVLSMVFSGAESGKLSQSSVVSFAKSTIIVFALVVPLSESLTAAASAIKLMSDFMLLYIPVFTGVVSASGQALTAFTYSGLMISFAELCQGAIRLYFIPLSVILTALNITSIVNTDVNAGDITKTIKKVITVILTVVSGVYTGLLTLKGNLALATDSVAVKGIKLISGSVIPFVGGAIGEAYTSVLGSFSLIKSTIGVFGIIVLILIILPPLVSNLVWYFMLSVCSVAGGVTSDTITKNIIDNLISLISLINILLLFSGVVFIVSTGLMLSLRG